MNKKILVVDDEKSILHALADKLAKEGLDVVPASNGKEGLEKALQENPDLIVLDLKMPVMGGEEMLEALRKDESGAKIPVVILSNLSSNSMINETIKLGTSSSLNDFFVKSDISLEEVVKLVKEKIQ